MTSNIEKFIQSAAPYGLWQALLGCLPGDSDILLGEDSNAAKMLESVLDDVERNGLNPQSIGYPSTEVVSSYPGLTALLRKKLLSRHRSRNCERKRRRRRRERLLAKHVWISAGAMITPAGAWTL